MLDALIGADGIDQILTVPHEFLGRIRIIPKIWVLNTGVEFLKPMLGRFHTQSLSQQFQRLGNLFDGVLYLCAHVFWPLMTALRT
jgi:hypothetical protein